MRSVPFAILGLSLVFFCVGCGDSNGVSVPDATAPAPATFEMTPEQQKAIEAEMGK